jgi:hypothetical protein
MTKAHNPLVSEADMTPTKLHTRSASRPRGVGPSAELVPLQFRMSAEIRQGVQTGGARPGHETQ